MKNKKALWIACAFLAVLLLGIAATGWFSGSAGQRYSGEADAPYPYAWVEKRDGTILLSLNAGESADGVWSAEAPGGTAEISLAAAKDGGTSALLKPRAAGREALLFRLHGGGALLAETVLTVEARETEGGRLALAVISHRQQAVQSRTDGGGARGCPFTASAAETGALLLHISDPDMQAANRTCIIFIAVTKRSSGTSRLNSVFVRPTRRAPVVRSSLSASADPYVLPQATLSTHLP